MKTAINIFTYIDLIDGDVDWFRNAGNEHKWGYGDNYVSATDKYARVEGSKLISDLAEGRREGEER